VVLGPKWRIHYYAHMQTRSARVGQVVRQGDQLGTVGTTGNAAGKPPHLHYTIVTMVPYPWRVSSEPQGWKKTIYLNPHELLTSRNASLAPTPWNQYSSAAAVVFSGRLNASTTRPSCEPATSSDGATSQVRTDTSCDRSGQEGSRHETPGPVDLSHLVNLPGLGQ